jgi:thiamine biosynthesis lipoprotein
MQLTRRALLKVPRAQAPATSEGFWLHLFRPAMACRFEVTLPSELDHHLDAAHAALDGVDRLEDQLTIFRDDSELSRINREAARGPVPVEPRLLALLRECHTLYAATEGAFDITTTPLSRIWGFLRREGRVPADEELAEALALVGMDKVHFQGDTVRFARPGMALNLGSIGKGYALDRVAEEMARTGVPTALLTAGSSSVLALGAGPDGNGYTVGLRDPGDHQRRLGTVRLLGNALGVSGIGEQSFTTEGRRLGHILDPRTGRPVEGRAYVAVVARTAALADALATAVFVGGRAVAERYVKEHPDVSILLIEFAPLDTPSEKLQYPTLIGSKSVWSLPLER